MEQRCRRRGALLLTLSSVALLAGALAAALLSPYLAVGSDHRITMDARGGGGWAAACRNTLPAACSHPLLMPALVLILLAIACGASWPTAASGKGARGAAWATCLAALPGAADQVGANSHACKPPHPVAPPASSPALLLPAQASRSNAAAFLLHQRTPPRSLA